MGGEVDAAASGSAISAQSGAARKVSAGSRIVESGE